MNKWVDQYNNAYCSIDRKPSDTDYSDLPEEIETNPKASKIKVDDRVRITKYNNFLVEVTLKICQEKYLLSILYWKLILWCIKLKI